MEESTRIIDRLVAQLEEKSRQLDAKAKELEELRRVLELSADSQKTFILEHALDAVVAVDDENRVTFWNEHAEKLFGWSKSEIMGRDMSDLIIPQQFRERHRAGIKRFVATGISRVQNRRLEIVGLRRNGEEFVMELTVSSLKTESGYLFYSFMRDISEMKEAQNAIKSSEATLAQLANSIPQLAWMAEPNGHIFWYNDRWFDYTGTTLEEMQGWGWQTVHDPEFLPAVLEGWTASVSSGKNFEMTFPLKGRNGDFRWFLTRVHPIKAADGTIVRWFGTNTDVHDQKLAAIELAENRERYKLLFESSPLPKWIFDIETLYFLDVNETAVRHYGYSREEFLSMRVTDIRPKDDVERFEKEMRENYDLSRTYVHKNFRHIKKDGSIIWVEPSTHDLVLNGQRVRFAAIVDVTERIQSEQRQRELMMRLQEAKQEAERANELKSAFLANMSHEIRTPLGAMMGFADLLKDPGLTASERQSFIDILSRNGESLSVIINDILDLSKVEAGHLTLEYTDTYPDQIGADVVSLLRVKAQEKDLVLDYTHDESSPRSIVADPIRVRQILLNLASNAVKFTQFGAVNIRSYACKTERGRHALCFEVSDTGIGIPKHLHERIFEMFVQADGSMTRRFGGTGLGLALSRSLARAMGGDVVITKSQERAGSTFLATIEDQHEKRNDFSKEAPRSSTLKEVSQDALKGVKILVVDDAPDNQRLFWRYLTKYGAIVESAENGLLGYRSAITGDFDLVLMDIQMPVMDGYAATQKLRDAGYGKPIVALTAHAMNEVRKKALNVGYTDHLTKPVDSKELVSTIARLVGR